MDSVRETPSVSVENAFFQTGNDANPSFPSFPSLPGMLAKTPNRSALSQFLPSLSRQQLIALSHAVDAFLIFISFIIAEKAYTWYFTSYYQVAPDYLLVALFCAMIYYFVSVSDRQKARGLSPSPALVVSKNLGISFAIVLVLGFALKLSEVHSRLWFTLASAIALGSLLAKHQAVRAVLKNNRLGLPIVESIALYGSGALAVKKALEAEGHGLSVVHVYDADAPTQAKFTSEFNRLLLDGLDNKFSRIILCLPPEQISRAKSLFAALDCFPVRIDVCAFSPAMESLVKDFQISPTRFLVNLDDAARNEWGMLVKRAIDFVFSALFVLFLSPLMLAIALAIKWDDGGPIFFRQRRHGWNHSVITVWKFRTMTVAEDGAVVTQATKNDPRVTRIGKFLRRTSLDELPQFFNVLSGEMSLVGPRPHAVAHNLHYSELISSYASRHKVKPGITGWAQVNGLRGNSEAISVMVDRAEADRWYIRNWSLWLDIRILLMTPFVLLSHKNADVTFDSAEQV